MFKVVVQGPRLRGGDLSKWEKMQKHWCVYILASRKDGVLYIGVTGDPARRMYEHKEALGNGFSKDYFVRKLVHIEAFDDPEAAIQREKRLKKWNRAWKIRLIEEHNPEWRDLYEDLNK